MRRVLALAIVLFGTLLATQAALAEWPANTRFDDAVTLDVTPEGFQAVTGMLPALLPSSIAIPEIHESDGSESCPCFGGCCFWVYRYWLDVTNGWVALAINNLTLQPKSGYLQLAADVNIQINSPADPMTFHGEVEAIGITLIDDYCYINIAKQTSKGR